MTAVSFGQRSQGEAVEVVAAMRAKPEPEGVPDDTIRSFLCSAICLQIIH